MKLFLDYGSMVISDISPEDVAAMAKENDFGSPDRWPVYKTTGLPSFILPDKLKRRLSKHPEWCVAELGEYQATFRTHTNPVDNRRQRLVLLYRRESNVLIVLYIDIPKKESDPDSPF